MKLHFLGGGFRKPLPSFAAGDENLEFIWWSLSQVTWSVWALIELVGETQLVYTQLS